MEWVETTGKTVEDAIEAALDTLGVDAQDAEVVIVDEPKAGLFGLRRSDARVRARVRPATPRPKRPQRSRRQRGPRTDAPRAPRNENGDRAAQSDAAWDDGAETAESAQPPSGERAGEPRRRRSRNGSSTRGTGAPARVNQEAEMSIEQQSEVVGAFVRGVVERFGFEATTAVKVEDDEIVVDVTGSDLGLLIGQRGATLDALQELARTIVQRRTEEHAARVVVDVAGFRARRAAALEEFARKVAADVLSSGVAEAMEPMSAADRKIIHDTVNAIAGVATTSEGMEPRRYVVVRPAGAEQDAGDGDGDGTEAEAESAPLT